MMLCVSHQLLLFVFVIVRAVVGQPVAEEAIDVHANLDGVFRSIFESQDESTAAWIGVYDPLLDDDLSFVYGLASADVAGGAPPTIPASLGQHFDIGSITKTVAGTVVLLLVEDGILSLEDTVEDLIPDFAEDFPLYANNTVSELLRMQTLVPDVEEDTAVLFEGDPTRRFDTIDPMVAAAMERYPADAPLYSSTNFLVLELIVDTLASAGSTDGDLRQLVQQWIFEPLGMNSSSFPELDGDGIRPEPSAIPYAGPACAADLSGKYGFPGVEAGDNVEEISRIIVFSGASGSIVSTIQDLLTWAKSAVGDKLLTDNMIQLRHQYDTPLEDGAILYGLAQLRFGAPLIFQLPSLDGWYGHSGGTYGFNSASYANQDLRGAAFAYATNDCSSSLELQLLDAFTKDVKARIAMENVTESPSATEGMPTDGPTMSSDSSTPMPSPTEPSNPTEMPSGSGSAQRATKYGAIATLVVMLLPFCKRA